MADSKSLGVGLALCALLGGVGCAKDAASGRCERSDGCVREAGAGGSAGDGLAGASGTAGSSGAGGSSDAGALPEPEEVALNVRFEDPVGMALDVVTLSCAGDCATVEAVVRGGHPPYAIEWDDGSTKAIREVCPDTSTELSVEVSDTAIHAEEFDYEGQKITSTIEAHVFDCEDGGVCEPGPGPDTPEPGHYEGTGSYVCDNDMSAESAQLINHLILALDLEIDEDAQEQGGQAFIQWGLVVIAGLGDLSGTLECGGALRATLVDASWGLPGLDPMTIIPTGVVTGEFTARRASEDGAITGSWVWTSMLPTGQYGNTCNGTYEAQRMP